jgi:hypothetical protein
MFYKIDKTWLKKVYSLSHSFSESLGTFISNGIPKCNTCIHYRKNKNNEEICLKFTDTNFKPLSIEISRTNELLCSYNGIHHKYKSSI